MEIEVGPSKYSKSSGVRGRFDEVREVEEESHGPGVEMGVERCRGDVLGGGVIETERCAVVMWMAGRAFQNDDVPGRRKGGMMRLVLARLVSGIALVPDSFFSCARSAASSRFRALSRSLLSFFLALRSSSPFSSALYGGTPFNKLVNTSRHGRLSKTPAMTEVAVRRTRFAGFIVGGYRERRMAI